MCVEVRSADQSTGSQLQSNSKHYILALALALARYGMEGSELKLTAECWPGHSIA